MKKVILLLCIMPGVAFSQISDNFESGDLGLWVESDPGHWMVDSSFSLSGKYSLHHSFDSPVAGSDQIGVPLGSLKPSMGTTRWSFMLKHGYDPSSSNNWSVFLFANNEPEEMHPGGNISGYALGVNFFGFDDTLRLWKIKDGIISPVLTTGINWQINIGTSTHIKVEIERTPEGIWSITLASSEGTIINSVSGTDPELFNARWFGIFYKYSMTCDRLLWIDNVAIDGVFVSDTEAPRILQVSPVSKVSLDLAFDEEANADFMSENNFSLNGSRPEHIDIIKSGSCSYRLTYGTPFLNKQENILTIFKICDELDNCSENITAGFTPIWAEPGDVVIAEIMADPLPPVSLPEEEYLEITNTTEFAFNLTGWRIASENQSSFFPESVVNRKENIIICSVTDTSLFSSFGKVVGLKSFPSLTDAGKIILLMDSEGNMIHGVEYSWEWYNDQLKKNGGWSLEMIDTRYPFNTDYNWRASVSGTGGTPGKNNSVSGNNPDISFHGIKNVFAENDTNLKVTFTEPVKDLELYKDQILIDGTPASSISPGEPLRRHFYINTGNPLLIRHPYLLELPRAVSDFSGNNIENNTYIFGLSEQAQRNDVIFNELLFNPYPGDADYIEFYNRSDRIIDVSQLYVVSINEESGDTSDLINVSETHTCLLPANFYAVTTDREAVINRYFSSYQSSVYEVKKLPSMNDDEGHLLLLNRQLDLIDEVRYDETMHYSLLSNYEGVALERVNPDVSSLDSKNWHSASETSGWGTPGTRNSVFIESGISGDNISLSSKRISPDNDGIEDLLLIGYDLAGNDNVISVLIFDETGTLVNRLAENLLAGPRGYLTWDGTSGDGSLLRSGIYIILVNVFDDRGKTTRWKKVCAVIR